MDQTPELISTEGGGIFESVEEPIYSKQRHIDPETILDVKPLTNAEEGSPPPPTIIPKEAASPASELQTEVAAKLKAKSPPIPARPQHKLARQFEQTVPKEKPVPPPRPTKPVLVAGGSKFAGLRAQFAKDLNERLAKPPAPLPTKKEEEVHSMDPEPVAVAVATAAVAGVVGEKVADVRKGRARGPTRRPPTVKPIVPAGWGVSEIAIVFEQKSLADAAEKVEGETQIGKREGEMQTGERVIEGENGVKTVYLDGKVADGGNEIGHAVVPLEKATEEPVEGEKEVAQPLEEGKDTDEESVEAKEWRPIEHEGFIPSEDEPGEVEKIEDMEEGHSGFHTEPKEESEEVDPQAKGENVEEY